MNNEISRAEIFSGWQIPESFQHWVLGNSKSVEGKFFIDETLDMVLEFSDVIQISQIVDWSEIVADEGWPNLIPFVIDTSNTFTCLRNDGAVIRPWGEDEGEFDLLTQTFDEFLSRLSSQIR